MPHKLVGPVMHVVGESVRFPAGPAAQDPVYDPQLVAILHEIENGHGGLTEKERSLVAATVVYTRNFFLSQLTTQEPRHTLEGAEPLIGRKERFCQELAAGVAVYEAFTSAGWKHPRGNAPRLLRDPEIRARTAHLKALATPYKGVCIAVRRAQLRAYPEADAVSSHNSERI